MYVLDVCIRVNVLHVSIFELGNVHMCLLFYVHVTFCVVLYLCPHTCDYVYG